MGRAAATGADVCVITSDNPRNEDPDDIIDEIVPGLTGITCLEAEEVEAARSGWVREVDRRAAIRVAIRAARDDDTVLIAGKGHEDYQVVGTKKLPFDDRQEALAALNEGE